MATKVPVTDRGLIALFALLGPVEAAAPRGLPVWLIVTAVVAAVRLYADRRTIGLDWLPRGWPAWVAAVWLVLVWAGTVWSPSSRAVMTAVEVVYVALGALLTGAALGRMAEEARARLRRWFLWGLAAGLAIFALDIVFDYPLTRWLSPGIESPMQGNTPKRSAGALALLAWPAASLLRTASGRRWAEGAAVIVLAIAAEATGSRSAQFGLLIGIVVGGVALWSARATLRALAGALVVAFLGVVPLAGFVAHRTGLIDAEWLFASARHRVEIWGRAAGHVPDAPVFGHGIDASRAMMPYPGETSRFDSLTNGLFSLHPHNGFLQVWLELGAAGAALTVILLLLVLRGIGRLDGRFRPPALALFATGLFMANTAYGVWQAWWMAAYAAAALLMACAARDERAA